MVEKTVLHNGVRIVTENVSGVHSVAVGIWVLTGSRHEQTHEHGIAHFVEHMLFKGTEKYTACDIAKRIDSVGGVFNAFTTKEYTCFYIKVLSQHLPLAIDLLCEIFFRSLFQQEEIEKERNVIMQEINMVKDTPDDYIQDIFYESYFSDHALGHNILGELETVKCFEKNDITGFFNREYLSPDRIIISAAGNISHQHVLEGFAACFDQLKACAAAHVHHKAVLERNISFHFRRLEQVHICLGTKGLSHLDPERYDLYVLSAILGGSMSSRLFQEIRENRGLAYSVYSFTTSFFDTGVFGVYMGLKREAVEEALHAVLKIIAQLRDEPVTAAELSNAQEQLKGNMLLALENTDSLMGRLAKCEMYYNAHIEIDEVIRSIDDVTHASVQELARRLFNNDYFTFTFLGPLKKKDLPGHLLTITQ
jgi:predicted Zn-dependent peptidase